jgi:hypothetical protein
MTFDEATIQFWQAVDTFQREFPCTHNTALSDPASTDPSFGTSPCDCCGCSLAGDRYSYECYTSLEAVGTDEVYHQDLCQDCVVAIENGDDPLAPYGIVNF